MSWHFLQGQEEVSSEAICWDGERFAPSSGPTTLGEYCLPDSETGCCLDSRFGMTSKHSTEILGEDESMSSRAGFPARTSAQPAKELESMGQGRECGSTWPGSFARYDRDSSSWKTPQCSLLEGLDVYSETWPRWGMMRNGACWERSIWEPITSARGSGLSPTIRAADGERGGRGDLIQAVRGNENSRFRMWHTPTADDAIERKRGKWNSRGEPRLSAEVMLWPTPTARDWKSGTGAQERPGHALPLSSVVWRAEIARFPTPLVGGTSEACHNQISGQWRKAMGPHLPDGGGPLNPTWVEWLMGWPEEWTDLKPLETDKFRLWQQQHSGF